MNREIAGSAGNQRGFQLFQRLSNLLYLFSSVVLSVLSVLLILVGLFEVVMALAKGHKVVNATLDAIGLTVIALAVFDIAKYLYEEEVTRDRELRSPREARRTKFLVIIAIAVTLEALVFIFETGTTDVANLIFPTALLVASVFLVIGLGWYQRLSAGTEHSDDVTQDECEELVSRSEDAKTAPVASTASASDPERQQSRLAT